MSKVIWYETNISQMDTKLPVRQFLTRYMAVEQRVGGLLDYGYDVGQIAKILNISYTQVERIMQSRGYKLVNELRLEFA